MLSPYLLSPPKTSLHLLTDPPKDHHLLHMWLEPWVPPCVLFGWWFSPESSGGTGWVHIVVHPMGLQTPSAPCVISLTP